ncbi:hypothetical protein [Arthrobacter sp. CAN_C5]|uniref:hypothetical protein n=1 Tax=Arthrobacter sp. CAN_C5 TaxID=2760706 RepID=UPI001AEB50AC|nr:hypothetical protein [Arthrobacter sp. CAN_C5]MBP2215097.1 hypothetical protein [Arthrobacter sp. CAN_C5]
MNSSTTTLIPALKTMVVPAERIVGTAWTAEQLRATADCYDTIRSHTLYASTAVRLASRTRLIDTSAARSIVTGVMGGIHGTSWMVAALTTAQLALSFPELLTDEQTALLLAPLAADESLAERGAVLPEAA